VKLAPRALHYKNINDIYIYITSQDIQWIPTRYPSIITIKKTNPRKEDALCMNMKPKLGALSLELKV